jgi:hypothetical protein
MSQHESVLLELDRQLAAQRTQVDALATRSGVMLAVLALLAGALPTAYPKGGSGPPVALLWLLGIGAVAGVLVLMAGRISSGPSPVELARVVDVPNTEMMLNAKLLATQANRSAITRTETLFYVMAASTVIAVSVLISSADGFRT